MQLIVVFDKDSTNDTPIYNIAGVADNQEAADSIAAIAASRGRKIEAYTDKYTISTTIEDSYYVVFPYNGESIEFSGDIPESSDIKIYKSEASAMKKLDEYVNDDAYTNGLCINAYLNEYINRAELVDDDESVNDE